MTAGSPWPRRWTAGQWLAWAAIVTVGFGLRSADLASVPAHNETADEYAWTWSGMTLLGEGRPIGWSWLSAYGRPTFIRWRDHDYPMVKPWVDHPPLFSVVMGAWMHGTGYHQILEVDLAHMRRAPLLLFLAQIGVFTVVLRHLVAPGSALVALALFATAPPAAILHRLVVSEALWVPSALGLWAFMLAWRRSPTRPRLIGVAATAALLPLTKVAALAFAAFCLAIAVRRRQAALVKAIVAGTAVGLAAYAAYGLAVSGGLFLDVLAAQAGRFHGFAGFALVLFSPRAVGTVGPYVPFLLGAAWCLALAARRRGPEWALAVPVYAAAVAVLANQDEIYAWYCLPLYPFYCLALADLFRRARAAGNPRAAWILALVATLELFSVVVDRGLLAPAGPARLAYVVAITAATLVLLLGPRARRLAPPAAATAVVTLCAAGILEILAR